MNKSKNLLKPHDLMDIWDMNKWNRKEKKRNSKNKSLSSHRKNGMK